MIYIAFRMAAVHLKNYFELIAFYLSNYGQKCCVQIDDVFPSSHLSRLTRTKPIQRFLLRFASGLSLLLYGMP